MRAAATIIVIAILSSNSVGCHVDLTRRQMITMDVCDQDDVALSGVELQLEWTPDDYSGPSNLKPQAVAVPAVFTDSRGRVLAQIFIHRYLASNWAGAVKPEWDDVSGREQRVRITIRGRTEEGLLRMESGIPQEVGGVTVTIRDIESPNAVSSNTSSVHTSGTTWWTSNPMPRPQLVPAPKSP